MNQPPIHQSNSTPTWHTMQVSAVLDQLETDEHGLTEQESVLRREQYGPNAIPDRPGPSVLSLVVRQFRNPLIYVLLLAGAVSVAIGEAIDAAFIFGVLAINAAVGAFQEWQAENGARALNTVVRVRATVRRGGTLKEIDARELAPGDVVLLESGVAVPADLRIVTSIEALVDESVLTGESTPIEKSSEAIGDSAATIGDRVNMLYAGTRVANGRLSAVVVETGAATQLGQIASSLENTFAPTPLVTRLHSFTTRLALFMLIFIAALAAIELIRGADAGDVFLLSIALAVSAIPEGLPVAVTVALSIASRRMAKRNVLVRFLPAVEGLGACTVIATDKTGTLTVNRMTAKRVVLADGFEIDIGGEGLDLHGDVTSRSGEVESSRLAELQNLATAGVLCNEAQLRENDGVVTAVGDTVDAAFLVLGEKIGIRRVEAEKASPRVGLIPYESARGYAASYNRDESETRCSVKGAVELVLDMCSDADRSEIVERAERLAADGFRVIAVAARIEPEFSDEQLSNAPSELQILGLVGLIDPVRADVPDAVEKCRQAGVQVKMVTGDHPITALAIARQIGIADTERQVLTGREMAVDGFDEARVGEAAVFARVEPAQKTGIVTTLQSSGHFVAVTGDGVNDAPALRAANIGVSMGRGGTDVAHDAADLIIADDNFASIVNGIEEGRTAYDNVRKIVWLLLATAVGELVLFLLSTITGQPVPLTPVQLLWLNVVTEGIQGVALSFERKEPGVLERPPRSPLEQILNRQMIEQIALSGTLMGVGGFAAYYWLLNVTGWDTFSASNALLLVMVLFENVHVFNSRSETRSAFRVPLTANPWVIGGVIAAQGLHIGAMYTPGLRTVLDIEPVSVATWTAMLGISLSVLVTAEAYKIMLKHRDIDGTKERAA